MLAAANRRKPEVWELTGALQVYCSGRAGLGVHFLNTEKIKEEKYLNAYFRKIENSLYLPLNLSHGRSAGAANPKTPY